MELWVIQPPMHHLVVIDDFWTGFGAHLLPRFAAPIWGSSPPECQSYWVLSTTVVRLRQEQSLRLYVLGALLNQRLYTLIQVLGSDVVVNQDAIDHYRPAYLFLPAEVVFAFAAALALGNHFGFLFNYDDFASWLHPALSTINYRVDLINRRILRLYFILDYLSIRRSITHPKLQLRRPTHIRRLLSRLFGEFLERLRDNAVLDDLLWLYSRKFLLTQNIILLLLFDRRIRLMLLRIQLDLVEGGWWGRVRIMKFGALWWVEVVQSLFDFRARGMLQRVFPVVQGTLGGCWFVLKRIISFIFVDWPGFVWLTEHRGYRDLERVRWLQVRLLLLTVGNLVGPLGW